MLELLGLLGGGVFRLVPFIVDFFKQKRDADHEYRMTQLQLEIDKARASQQIDLANAQAAIAANTAEMTAMVAALQAQSTPSGVPWIDGLSASVRPVLTYWWCLVLYTGHKAILVYMAFITSQPLLTIAPLLMTDFDKSVVGSIFGFWFVDRALRKAMK
jgi:hypothetical protein